jgi:hypothetical protein
MHALLKRGYHYKDLRHVLRQWNFDNFYVYGDKSRGSLFGDILSYVMTD